MIHDFLCTVQAPGGFMSPVRTATAPSSFAVDRDGPLASVSVHMGPGQGLEGGVWGLGLVVPPVGDGDGAGGPVDRPLLSPLGKALIRVSAVCRPHACTMWSVIWGL